MAKVKILKKRKLYNFQEFKPKTLEDGFNDGMAKWDELGDKADMGFIPRNSYERGLLDGFSYARNQFMEFIANNPNAYTKYKQS